MSFTVPLPPAHMFIIGPAVINTTHPPRTQRKHGAPARRGPRAARRAAAADTAGAPGPAAAAEHGGLRAGARRAPEKTTEGRSKESPLER
jgi:hypothetical protein